MQYVWMASGAALICATAALAEERTYAITGFDQIETSTGVTVDVTVGADFSVIGEARQGDIADLLITQDGNTLKVSREATDRRFRWSILNAFDSNDDFYVSITLPDLSAVEATSGSRMTVSGATAGLDTVNATSGAHVTIADGAVDAITLQSTSGAHLEVSGNCTDLIADATSGARLDAGGLHCDTAQLTASSGASLEVHARESVDADASSGASVRVLGGAAANTQNISSGASFRAD